MSTQYNISAPPEFLHGYGAEPEYKFSIAKLIFQLEYWKIFTTPIPLI